jgi:hypothetical protein
MRILVQAEISTVAGLIEGRGRRSEEHHPLDSPRFSLQQISPGFSCGLPRCGSVLTLKYSDSAEDYVTAAYSYRTFRYSATSNFHAFCHGLFRGIGQLQSVVT